MSDPFQNDVTVVKKAQIQPSSVTQTSLLNTSTTPAPSSEVFWSKPVPSAHAWDKILLSALYAPLLIVGLAFFTPETKQDSLSDFQYRCAGAGYFAVLPLLVFGYISLPWLTFSLGCVAALVGYYVVGSPRASVKLKEMTALCLTGLCISGWVENITTGLFSGGGVLGGPAGYGVFLGSLLRPKTSLAFSLCRAPIALGTVGLVVTAFRVGTMHGPKPTKLGIVAIAISASTCILTGAAAIMYLVTGTALAVHPFPFFGGPPKLVIPSQEATLLLLSEAALFLATYLYRDAQFRQALQLWGGPLDTAREDEDLLLQDRSNKVPEDWKRSFSMPSAESIANTDDEEEQRDPADDFAP
ncbi:putative transmembrane protein [Gregarina niphandrodes]|uniref:Transmembrane protein n=1 Tax=Gregarina niphandrodes TaxID=110365 RepID=A0A023B0S2_GRENI|nr:putative transmembrane protein [Gregarina niphandrodes]EZG45894.1 putative transmembrane protein [Gregarina niphandrodes]|eukprot:XP_011132420.1 putative transmembrane protein [Gregarina niphandrodes]